MRAALFVEPHGHAFVGERRAIKSLVRVGTP
jgi:hypothetical protein